MILNTEPSEKIARDPRIDELRSGGLSWRWLTIAETIGYDSFVVMWRMASELFMDSDIERTSTIRIVIPHARKLERIQRDRLIVSLASEGLDVADIQNELKKRIQWNLGRRQIARIIEKSACRRQH